MKKICVLKIKNCHIAIFYNLIVIQHCRIGALDFSVNNSEIEEMVLLFRLSAEPINLSSLIFPLFISNIVNDTFFSVQVPE